MSMFDDLSTEDMLRISDETRANARRAQERATLHLCKAYEQFMFAYNFAVIRRQFDHAEKALREALTVAASDLEKRDCWSKLASIAVYGISEDRQIDVLKEAVGMLKKYSDDTRESRVKLGETLHSLAMELRKPAGYSYTKESLPILKEARGHLREAVRMLKGTGADSYMYAAGELQHVEILIERCSK